MATISEKALKLLFPKGELAWRGMQNGTQGELAEGLAIQIERDRQSGKNIVNDFYPSTTTLQKEWEEVFRLPSGELLTVEQRAKRLEASFSKIAPGSFDGMNEIYELSGLDVIARPLIPGEDPRIIATTSQGASESLVPTFQFDTNYGINNRYGANSIYGKFSYPLKPAPSIVYHTIFGEAKYGLESIFGDFTETFGTVQPKIFADGRPGIPVKNYISKYGKMRYGNISTSSRYGNFEGFLETDPILTIPDDVWTWAMIYIIEDSSGNFAQIPIELKEAFEFITYKNKPEFMWGISRVEYV